MCEMTNFYGFFKGYVDFKGGRTDVEVFGVEIEGVRGMIRLVVGDEISGGPMSPCLSRYVWFHLQQGKEMTYL